MKLKVILILIFLISHSFSLENKILFKINNEIVTTIDLYNEIKYLKFMNKNLVESDDNRIFEIAKNSLIREKIKEIELYKTNKSFNITEDYLTKLISDYSKKNGFNSSLEFENFINDNKLDFEEIKNKIKIEVLWNQLIISKYLKDVKIDKEKIKKSIKEYQNEFLLSEIVFNVKNSKNYNSKLDLIKKDINEKGFANASIIHGISDSSKEGGKLGWIKENSLNPNIKNKILEVNIGGYTDPIVIPGGFLILLVEDVKKTKREFNEKDEINSIINYKTNQQLNMYSIIHFNKIKKNVLLNEL